MCYIFKVGQKFKVLKWHKRLSYSSILTTTFCVVFPKRSTKTFLYSCIYVEDFIDPAGCFNGTVLSMGRNKNYSLSVAIIFSVGVCILVL